ncbi:hypothetical protein ACFWN2_12580 [Lentzea sp. NPDC058436]|uniref:hypothetical protein n=1 Tax=Lentzea sp. NPDC058436 TaxID=3346499 RepID=UPI003663BD21
MTTLQSPPPRVAPWQPNRRSVRYAIDLLGGLGLLAGLLTATFTLAFGGVLVLMAGLCLHMTSVRTD